MPLSEFGNNGNSRRRLVPMESDEAMRLLAGSTFGRVVYTQDALPAIRAVNHLVDAGAVVVRTRLSSRLTSFVREDPDVVVAYEVDEIDPELHVGWSVVVTGLARTVTDPGRVAHYEKLLQPWVDKTMDTVIQIEPTLVTGLRLVETDE